MTTTASHDSVDPTADQQAAPPDELEHWLTDLRANLSEDPPGWITPDNDAVDPLPRRGEVAPAPDPTGIAEPAAPGGLPGPDSPGPDSPGPEGRAAARRPASPSVADPATSRERAQAEPGERAQATPRPAVETASGERAGATPAGPEAGPTGKDPTVTTAEPAVGRHRAAD